MVRILRERRVIRNQKDADGMKNDGAPQNDAPILGTS